MRLGDELEMRLNLPGKQRGGKEDMALVQTRTLGKPSPETLE